MRLSLFFSLSHAPLSSLFQVLDVFAIAHKYEFRSILDACSKYTEQFFYSTEPQGTIRYEATSTPLPSIGASVRESDLQCPLFWIKEASRYQAREGFSSN